MDCLLGEPAVSSYRVRAFITTDGTQEPDADELGCTVDALLFTYTCDVTGLADGTSYLFDVIATNSIGDSDPSQMQVPAIPSAPVAQSRFESAKVGWIAQPTVGGDPTSYTITASPTGNSCTITLPDDTCIITGLSNSQAYTFTATATNAIGTSSASSASGSVTPGTAFVSTWRTQNSGVSGTNQIRLPLVSGTTFNVSWGDGTSETITSSTPPTHLPDPRRLRRHDHRTIPAFQFANGGDKLKIVDIARWGPLRFGQRGQLLPGCVKPASQCDRPLDLRFTTNLSSAFSGASKFNGAIGNWDVSNVTTWRACSSGGSVQSAAQRLGNKDLQRDRHERMFTSAVRFNQPINTWDVSKVTTFLQMFNSANAFNSSVSGWVPSAATNMQYMFVNTASFNQPIDWTQTGNVTTMLRMFQNAPVFDQSLASLNTSNVTDMASMFQSATNFNGDVSDLGHIQGHHDGSRCSTRPRSSTMRAASAVGRPATSPR